MKRLGDCFLAYLGLAICIPFAYAFQWFWVRHAPELTVWKTWVILVLVGVAYKQERQNSAAHERDLQEERR